MEVTAQSKTVRISPRKIRLVADAVRNLSVDEALMALQLLDKRGAGPLLKALNSAIANAIHNGKLDRSKLVISQLTVTEGPSLKRFRPSTRGRVHPYKRKSSHIRVVVKEGGSHGTKS